MLQSYFLYLYHIFLMKYYNFIIINQIQISFLLMINDNYLNHLFYSPYCFIFLLIINVIYLYNLINLYFLIIMLLFFNFNFKL